MLTIGIYYIIIMEKFKGNEMARLFKSTEIARRYGIPTKTAFNWSKEEGTWRRKLYDHLEKMYAREIAEKLRELDQEEPEEKKETVA